MTEQQILSKLTTLCSGSEHCSWEMLENMQKWEVDEKTQAHVMEYLIREKYVDDERFCRAFIRDKIEFSKWGRRKIEQALYQKHIDKSISNPIFEEIEDEQYVEILRPLIKTKENTVKAKNDYEKNLKLIKFALSRGFSFNVIKKCLDVDDVDISEE